jgi:uncharacterized membrane protein
LIFIAVGVLLIALGNYFKVIQLFHWNKTPWTLESKEVWKLTHILAGNYGLLEVVNCIGSLTIDKSVLFISL